MTANEIFDKHGLDGFPTVRKTRMVKSELQTMLTGMAFPIMVAGHGYDLANKRIGPGVYEVWLKPWKAGGGER